MKDGEERFEMCKAFEDYRLEGKEEGERNGMRKQSVKQWHKGNGLTIKSQINIGTRALIRIPTENH